MSVHTSRRDARELEQVVAAQAARHQVPGVAVGICQGEVDTFVCHGVTSVENPLAVDERTLFQIGSSGKTFTATALLRLAEQGRVDVDATVRTYLPGFQVRDEDVAASVTVLQLINHTAGWRGDYFADTGVGDDALERFVDSMAELEQTHALGVGASYNNAAFCVAGRIIEVVTGQPFEAAVRDLVLQPLGLTETFYGPAEAITRRTAIGHTNTPQGPQVARPFEFPRAIAPSGAGLVSSVRDQIAYARVHLGDGSAADGTPVLSAGMLQRMQQPTASFGAEHGTAEAIGISWLLSNVAGARVVMHGGATLGQMSAFKLLPDHAFGFTVLTNASLGGGQLHAMLSDWILEHYLGLSEPILQPLTLSSAALSEYCGAFCRDDGTILQVSADDDHLVISAEIPEAVRKEMQAALGTEIPLPPPMPVDVTDGDGFIPHDQPARRQAGRFIRDSSGHVSAMQLGGRLARRSEVRA